jgi:hypothetical protein
MRTTPQPSSKDGRTKLTKLNAIKQQQTIWMEGMRQESRGHGSVRPEQMQEKDASQVSLQNWCNISSNSLQFPQASHSMNGICRVCVSRLTRPTMLIPCGHSFCESVP